MKLNGRRTCFRRLPDPSLPGNHVTVCQNRLPRVRFREMCKMKWVAGASRSRPSRRRLASRIPGPGETPERRTAARRRSHVPTTNSQNVTRVSIDCRILVPRMDYLPPSGVQGSPCLHKEHAKDVNSGVAGAMNHQTLDSGERNAAMDEFLKASILPKNGS